MTSTALLATLALAAAPDYDAAARGYLDDLAGGAHEKLFAHFGPNLQQALPAEKLAQVWAGVVTDAGAFQRVLTVRATPAPPYMVMDLDCAFASKTLTVRLALDGQLKVQGLFFTPAWNPPPDLDRSGFTERELAVGSKDLPLPATLTVPTHGKAPFPAVVLVHGSGPNDADETIGPNKLFKELAWGLASRGVAVLRYQKRTFQYRGKLANTDVPTVKEETLDDASSAVTVLAAQKDVRADRLFVAGHSMGAWLAPRIAAADPRLRGAVMLAASSRPQWHLVVEQLAYLSSLEHTPALEQALANAKVSAKKLDDPALKPTDVVDGIPGTYWLDMRGYDALAVARKLGRPLLVLQGGRDYQVTAADFEGWKKALGAVPTATLKLFPELNHQFMPGTGKSTPAEYQKLNHVPAAVLDTLAGWVAGH